MFFQGLHRVGRIVFAADREQDSALIKIEHRLLHRLVCGAGILRAELNPFHAVFTDDAAPHGVVEIGDEHLGQFSGERMQESHPFLRQMDQLLRRHRHTHGQPLSFVAPTLPSVACDQRIVVEDVDAPEFPRDVSQLRVEPLHGLPFAVLRLRIENSLPCDGRRFYCVNYQVSGAALAKHAQPGSQRIRLVGLHRQNDGLRLKSIQRTFRRPTIPAHRH